MKSIPSFNNGIRKLCLKQLSPSNTTWPCSVHFGWVTIFISFLELLKIIALLPGFLIIFYHADLLLTWRLLYIFSALVAKNDLLLTQEEKAARSTFLAHCRRRVIFAVVFKILSPQLGPVSWLSNFFNLCLFDVNIRDFFFW